MNPVFIAISARRPGAVLYGRWYDFTLQVTKLRLVGRIMRPGTGSCYRSEPVMEAGSLMPKLAHFPGFRPMCLPS